MSELKEVAPFAVELQEVHLTESTNVCEMNDNRFTKNMKNSGLQIFYCGEYLVFERAGFVPQSVAFGLAKRMTSLKDFEGAHRLKAQAEQQKKLKEETDKLLAAEAKRKAAENYALQKMATLAAKVSLPEGEEPEAARAAEDAAADIAETPLGSPAAVQEIAGLPPPPPPRDAKELIKDMRAERGKMGDEEERSMKAAVARAESKARRR